MKRWAAASAMHSISQRKTNWVVLKLDGFFLRGIHLACVLSTWMSTVLSSSSALVTRTYEQLLHVCLQTASDETTSSVHLETCGSVGSGSRLCFLQTAEIKRGWKLTRSPQSELQLVDGLWWRPSQGGWGVWSIQVERTISTRCHRCSHVGKHSSTTSTPAARPPECC